MRFHAALAAAATLVAVAFCLATLERWLARRRRHELAWTLALALFAGGSAALWVGATFGWNEWSFKAFYLCGAIANVPVLAVGTVYLLMGDRAGNRAFAGAVLFATFATGWVLAAPLLAPVPVDELPRGSEVFGAMPRVLAAVGSGVGATVLLAGALWSCVALVRHTRAPGDQAAVSSTRLAAANGLIALGTLVLSAGGLLNSVVGEMDAFSISLVTGVILIFAGFLASNPPASPPARPSWLQGALDEPLAALDDGALDEPLAALDDGSADDGPEAENRRAPEAYATLRGPREN